MNNHSVPPEYETFELLVGAHTGNGYPVAVLQSLTGEVSALCRLDPQGYELSEALAALAERALDGEGLRQIGDYLFTELFIGDIAHLFRSNLAVVRTQQKQLRVRLRIEAPELAALPWEYLYDAVEDRFLATANETALVRFLPLRLPARPTKINLPLRLLLVIASPHDLPQLDVTAEIALIRAALRDPIQAGRLDLHIVEHGTLAAITQALREHQPHIFHFVGHGFFDGVQAALMLEDDNQAARLIGERDFRELFAASNETRLALLNACQSATLSSSQPLVGLAPQLLQRQLSAVIAMQFPIRDDAALIFSRDFYRSLALGYPVEAAMSEGRRGILLELGSDTLDWGTPVLFLRAKDGQLFQIETPAATIKAILDIPLPPEPTRPPQHTGFIGRAQELATYTTRLQQNGVVAITGMPGVGKSALAATLAAQVSQPEKIFWHTFHQGETALSLIWKVAAFLAWQGKVDLWNQLQSAQLTGGQPPPPTVLIDYVIQLLRGQDYLLCLDDFHLLYDSTTNDPLLNQLIERLKPALTAGDLRLIIAARTSPRLLDLITSEPLVGLSSQDTQALLTARAMPLSTELAAQLYARTEGNAELLTLAIQSLRQSTEPARMIARLAASEDIEQYLIGEVDESLSNTEKEVMSGVAILLGQPGTRDAIEITLDQGSIRRTLTYLTNRYLLTIHAADPERAYAQHAMVREFYYDLLGLKARQAMHARAAEYYEFQAEEPLLAAQHYVRAGDHKRAAHLATTDIITVINRGQTGLLQQLLSAIDTRKVDQIQQAELQIVQGEIDHYFRRSDDARHHYTTALPLLEALPALTMARRRRAHIHRRMGELLLYQSPAEGLDWVQRGLTLLGEEDKAERAALLIQLGALQNMLSNSAEALVALHAGLALTPPGTNQHRVDGLINLGAVYGSLGETAKAIDYSQQALALCEQLHDPYRIMQLSINLGLDQYDSGDHEGGIATLRQALKLAEQLGSLIGQAQAAVNLGDLLLSEERVEEAKDLLEQKLPLARLSGQVKILATMLTNLGNIYLKRKGIVTASSYIAEAKTLAHELEAQDILLELQYIEGTLLKAV